MQRTYPQETMGRTLVDVREEDERRRVFVRSRPNYVEVGEFTRGLRTQDHFGAPVHFHCVHVAQELQDAVVSFFGEDELYLVDLMDELDREGVSYGYLNDMVGRYVSYRPARG